MIEIELEERIQQACTIIDLLIKNPTSAVVIALGKGFIEENTAIEEPPFYVLKDFKGESELGF